MNKFCCSLFTQFVSVNKSCCSLFTQDVSVNKCCCSLFTQDVSVNVRKRIIKIFQEVAVTHPSFSRIPDICVRMISRVGDEDGVVVSDAVSGVNFGQCSLSTDNQHRKRREDG